MNILIFVSLLACWEGDKQDSASEDTSISSQ